MDIETGADIAIWVVTPNGASLAERFQTHWDGVSVFCSETLPEATRPAASKSFTRLTTAVENHFHRFRGHVFIMATGIVVRIIAAHLRHKTHDPAVVVVDDRGCYAISLTSGHIGGANQLAHEVAERIGATPVITTATDVNEKPAIDVMATARGLKIKTPDAIKTVNMALLTHAPVQVYDPEGWIESDLSGVHWIPAGNKPGLVEANDSPPATIWVDDTLKAAPPGALVLRPPSLVAGIGCNRNTPRDEIHALLDSVMAQFDLAPSSLRTIASIDIKSDEVGLCDLAADMGLPIQFFSKTALSGVAHVPTPSAMVNKHIGVPSVCEAAAILASRNGRLIVPKQNTKNVTVAIARMASTSSASGPGM